MAVCETCHGSGKLTIDMPITGRSVYPQLPCAACNGTGIGYCCDGLIACNEVEAEEEDGDGD